jgi:apolipoprotein D and lipocalin family protein
MKLLIITLALFLSACAHAQTKTVDHVDLKRYLGIWYEIASIPQFFSEGCFCSRAQYGLRSDGKISVYNTCNKNSITGNLDSVSGSAQVVDQVSNAKLSVTFFWPFSGEYWIIGLDTDYRYAVVSNSGGTDLWILSRTPVLNKELLDEALVSAKANGADPLKLRTTQQAGCSYP